MRNKKLAVVFLIVGVICLLLGIRGQAFEGILLAGSVLFFILAHAANRPTLPVEPMTGKPRNEPEIVDSQSESEEILWEH